MKSRRLILMFPLCLCWWQDSFARVPSLFKNNLPELVKGDNNKYVTNSEPIVNDKNKLVPLPVKPFYTLSAEERHNIIRKLYASRLNPNVLAAPIAKQATHENSNTKRLQTSIWEDNINKMREKSFIHGKEIENKNETFFLTDFIATPIQGLLPSQFNAGVRRKDNLSSHSPQTFGGQGFVHGSPHLASVQGNAHHKLYDHINPDVSNRLFNDSRPISSHPGKQTPLYLSNLTKQSLLRETEPDWKQTPILILQRSEGKLSPSKGSTSPDVKFQAKWDKSKKTFEKNVENLNHSLAGIKDRTLLGEKVFTAEAHVHNVHNDWSEKQQTESRAQAAASTMTTTVVPVVPAPDTTSGSTSGNSTSSSEVEDTTRANTKTNEEENEKEANVIETKHNQRATTPQTINPEPHKTADGPHPMLVGASQNHLERRLMEIIALIKELKDKFNSFKLNTQHKKLKSSPPVNALSAESILQRIAMRTTTRPPPPSVGVAGDLNDALHELIEKELDSILASIMGS